MALEKVVYGGWPTCYRLSNGRIELIVTGDVGPRIIRFGFVNGENLFYEDPAARGKSGGDDWRLYGGHRLWHAPEHPVRTYYPDNGPISVTETSGGAHISQPTEPTTGIRKEISLTMDSASAHVRLTHKLTNEGPWPVTLAIWGLSVMAGGGTAIIPLPPRGEHPRDLLPTTQLAIWPYTNMADTRWTWGESHILLRQRHDPPQKIGALVSDGWVAYARKSDLFVKRFTPLAGAAYPDLGSNVEVFTNQDMLEVESLSPIGELAPGASVEHVEDWYLFDGASAPENDADVESRILPLVAKTGG